MSTESAPSHCLYGHLLTSENDTGNPHRRCKLCALYASRAFRLGITLDAYMQNEVELNRTFYKVPRHSRLDWSKPQNCPVCGRGMRPNKPAPADDTRVTYGGKGMCKTCYVKALRAGNL